MKRFLVLFKTLVGVLVSFHNFSQAKTKPPELQTGMSLWVGCTEDGDCIVIPGLCQRPLAINKKYKSEAEHYVYWQNAKRKCAERSKDKIERDSRAIAYCENGIARVRYDQKLFK